MKKLTIMITVLFIATAGIAQPKVNVLPPDDKDWHKFIGAGISAGTSLLVYAKTKRVGLSLATGFGAGVVAGVGKELIYDKLMRRGTPSGLDAIATVFGSAVGTICVAVGINVHRTNQLDREFYEHLNGK